MEVGSSWLWGNSQDKNPEQRAGGSRGLGAQWQDLGTKMRALENISERRAAKGGRPSPWLRGVTGRQSHGHLAMPAAPPTLASGT